MTTSTVRRRASRRPYVVAALGVGLVVLLAWVNRGRLQPVMPGRAAPDFAVPDLKGDIHRLSDFAGEKVVLLNVWATWCLPCREEMPSMERLYAELDREDFVILAVSIDANFGGFDIFGRPGGDIQAFADSLGLTFMMLHNVTGDIQRTFQTTGVPETFLIGKDGLIYKKVTGGTMWDSPENRELILRLLEQ
ncbi:MAG: TlpA disulfide reductase family protein [Gemmatimonadota bacterium]|nr:MAG: TlpA disulfide reductase family protein [Gemmatimonadota bacterium]